MPKPDGHASKSAAPAASIRDPDSHARLLAEPSTHYTVQLIAFSSREGMDGYVARQGLQDLPRARVRSKGRPFHVLLLGVYPNREAATRAAAGLPPELAGLTPWVRSMASLQRATLADG